MFRIAVCDEDRMVRRRLEQVVTTYMKEQDYKIQVIESVSKNKVPENVHIMLDLQEMVTHTLEQLLVKNNSILFSFQEEEMYLIPSQIVYVESKLHRLYFHLIGERVYTMYDVLNKWEDKLQDYNFLRIHQSYLVNMKYIMAINSYVAYLENDVKLTIPRKRYRQVRENFEKYQKGANKHESNKSNGGQPPVSDNKAK